MRELYGNSNYQPVGKQIQPKEIAKDQDTKSRKAGMLNSHVLTRQDDAEDTKAGWDFNNGRLASASNAGWAAQTNL